MGRGDYRSVRLLRAQEPQQKGQEEESVLDSAQHPTRAFLAAHVGAALAHFVTAVVFTERAVNEPVRLMISRITCTPLQRQQDGGCNIDWKSARPLYGLWLLAGFAWITSASHVVQRTLWRPLWQYMLKQGPNWARWSEYSVTCGLMNVVLILTAGETSATSVLLAFSVAAGWMPAGFLSEVRGKKEVIRGPGALAAAWLPAALSYIGFVWGMFGTFHYFASGNNLDAEGTWKGDAVNVDESKVPGWVYVVVVGVVTMYTAFPIAAIVTQWKGLSLRCREWIYLWLSFISKMLLLWAYFYGITRIDDEGNTHE